MDSHDRREAIPTDEIEEVAAIYTSPGNSAYRSEPTAVAVTDARDIAAPLRRALDDIGARVLPRISVAQAIEGRGIAADLLVLDWTDTSVTETEQLLALADQHIGEHGGRVFAAIRPAQIDVAYALLNDRKIQLLCDASEAEHAEAVQRAFAAPANRVQDVSSEKLEQLTAEVERLRLTLAEIAAERTDMPAGDHPITAMELRQIIRARRMRDQFFPGDIFADPAWDILLDLYATHLQGKRVAVSSVCIAAAVPATTALRWISRLEEKGLLKRHRDEGDGRRWYISVSGSAIDALHAFFSAAKTQRTL